MKRLAVLMTFAMLLLASFTSMAAGAPSKFVVQSVSLTQCSGPLIEGQLQLAVVDSAGVILNGSIAAATTVYATHSNGPVGAVSWDFVAGQSYQFAFVVGSADVTGISMTVLLNGTTISSPLIKVNCDGTTQVGSPVQGPAAGDARLNAFNCDLTSALYAVGSGISVWDIGADSKGTYKGVYTLADVGDLADAAPEVNTFVKSLGHTSLEVLTTGEYQIKIGPDETGKVCTMVADGLPPSSVYFLP
jgi:hypothetical protein